MPPKLSTALSNTTPLILDGALATYLETLGANISSALWSASILIDQPSLILRTHKDYFLAGANIAITASYQASIPGLVKHLNLSDSEAKAVVRKSVELAIHARQEIYAESRDGTGNEDRKVDGGLWVAGSVGPYGAYLADGSEYRGDYSISKDEMKDFHRGRIEALVEAGVDILACETIPQLAEAEALLELLQTEFSDTEAWFAFTLRDAEHISDGTSLGEIASLFEGVEQVVGIGFNCVADDVALAALENLRPLVKRGTLVVYPNSGESWNAAAREWEGDRTEGATLVEKTVKWREAGAGLIGGCCRTTPDDIRTMCEALRPS